MVFLKEYSNSSFAPLERANLVLDMIKESFKNFIEVPKYNCKNITELKAIEYEYSDYIKIEIE
jgi:uncharacterized protein YsxB (DUF464 family)